MSVAAQACVDSFSPSTTNVELNVSPNDTTGVERIIIAAQGDLQRLLSAFFGRPINIQRIYADTSSRDMPASASNPITQARQVYLVCSERVICIATSSVTLTSATCERLLLDEGFAIGQLFRHLQLPPNFTLLEVITRTSATGKRELQRTYLLETEGIRCEIVELFPDRDMFDQGTVWLTQTEPQHLDAVSQPTSADVELFEGGSTVHVSA